MIIKRILPESRGQNLALTVLYVPYLLDSDQPQGVIHPNTKVLRSQAKKEHLKMSQGLYLKAKAWTVLCVPSSHHSSSSL